MLINNKLHRIALGVVSLMAVGAFLFLGAYLLFLPKIARAQASMLPTVSNCAPRQTVYSAVSQNPPDTYDIFVRLGLRGQKAKVSLYFQGFTANTCQLLGSAAANSDKWTKIGDLRITKQNGLGAFSLASSAARGLPNANRPSIMLVSKTHPVCHPTNNCYVKINDKQAILRPAAITSSTDSLHAVTVTDPVADTVLRVDYYIDNKPAYSRPTIQPFDMRFVSGGKHDLATIITYKSKQQAVIAKTVNLGTVDDLNYFIFSYFTSKKPLWLIIGGIILAFILLDLLLAIARQIYRRRMWKAAHIANQPTADNSQELEPSDKPKFQTFLLKFIHNDRRIAKKVSIAMSVLLILIVGFSAINKWALQFYSVDGSSMQSSYQNGNLVLINKLGSTFSTVGGKGYTPKRGEVVIFRKERDVMMESIESGQPTFVIKRVIGLPGERVIIHRGRISVRSALNPKGIDPDKNRPWTKNLKLSPTDEIDVTLQTGEIFVSGDNRPESIDSRSYGPVKLHELVGSVIFSL